MKDHGLLLFILALPALAVLGHDSYLAYTNTQYELAERFYLSDLGWLWKTYHIESMEWARFAFEPEVWSQFIDPILEQKALLIMGFPFLVAVFSFITMKILGVGPYEGQGLKMMLARTGKKKKSKDFSFTDVTGPKKRAKYKRK